MLRNVLYFLIIATSLIGQDQDKVIHLHTRDSLDISLTEEDSISFSESEIDAHLIYLDSLKRAAAVLSLRVKRFKILDTAQVKLIKGLNTYIDDLKGYNRNLKTQRLEYKKLWVQSLRRERLKDHIAQSAIIGGAAAWLSGDPLIGALSGGGYFVLSRIGILNFKLL